jgi:hypothetical protein
MLLMTNKIYETRSTGFVYDVLVSAKEIPAEYVHYFTDKKKIPDNVSCIKTNSIVLADIAHEIELNENKETALEVLDKMISYAELEPSGVIINVSKTCDKNDNIKSQAYLNYCEWFVNNELSLCEKGKEYCLTHLENSIDSFVGAKSAPDLENKIAFGNLNWVDEIWSFSSNLITRNYSKSIKNIYITYDDDILTDIINRKIFGILIDNILLVFMMTVNLLIQTGNLSKEDKLNVYFEKGLVFRDLLKYIIMSQRFHKVGLVNDYDVLPNTMKVCMKLTNYDDRKHKRKIEYSARIFNDPMKEDIRKDPTFQLGLDDSLSNTKYLLDNTFKNDLLSVNITSKYNGYFQISSDTFYRCKNLTYFDYDRKLIIRSIGSRAFYKTGLKRIKLKEGLTDISFSALAYTDIEQIKFPSLTDDYDEICRVFNRNSKITSIKSNTYKICDLFNYSMYHDENYIFEPNSNLLLDLTINKIGADDRLGSPAIKGRFIKRLLINNIDDQIRTIKNICFNRIEWLTECNIWEVQLNYRAVGKLFSAYLTKDCRDNIERFLRYTFGNSEIHTSTIVINKFVEKLAEKNRLDRFKEYLSLLLNRLFNSKTVFVSGL